MRTAYETIYLRITKIKSFFVLGTISFKILSPKHQILSYIDRTKAPLDLHAHLLLFPVSSPVFQYIELLILYTYIHYYHKN